MCRGGVKGGSPLAVRRSEPLTLLRHAYAPAWLWLRHFAAMAMTTKAADSLQRNVLTAERAANTTVDQSDIRGLVTA
jgi:hypothetical protein